MITMYCTEWALYFTSYIVIYCTSYRSYTVLVKLDMLNFNASTVVIWFSCWTKKGLSRLIILSVQYGQLACHWVCRCWHASDSSTGQCTVQQRSSHSKLLLRKQGESWIKIHSIDLLDRLRQLPWPSTAYRVPRNLEASRENVFEFIAEISVHCFHWWTFKTYTMS